MSFETIGVKKELVETLKALKITEPTPVQAGAIPILMQGKDLIVRSKTGSGKTYAFSLPILTNLEQKNEVQCLILAPTRELAVQIAKDIRKADKNVKILPVYGGVGISPQIEKLHHWAQIVVGTPGRIIDHLERGTFNTQSIRYVVLDEADRMFEMGFIDDLRTIMKHVPKQRQTMLFSATMPEEVVRLSKDYMHNPERLILDQDEITVKKIQQVCYGIDRMQKIDALMAVLARKEVTKVLIFCNTKRWADSLGKILYRKQFKVGILHSDLSQNRREAVIEDFKNGKYEILVATDVAARGLHIENISHVINYDLPKNPKDYIHRIGRTGRIGAKGQAISFMTQMDQPFLRGIEQEIQQFLDVQVFEGLPPPRPHYEGNREGGFRQQEPRQHTERFERRGNTFRSRETVSAPTQERVVENTDSSWERWD